MKGVLVLRISGRHEPECIHDGVYIVPASATDEQVAEFAKALGSVHYEIVEIFNLSVVTKQALSVMQE
jgi:hypothetical protein